MFHGFDLVLITFHHMNNVAAVFLNKENDILHDAVRILEEIQS